MIERTMTIGFLARAANVNIETIRYYQRVGLIKEPKKPTSGYRQYSCNDVNRIKFIKRAQKLGFNLTEISELLELGDGHCKRVRQRAVHKRDMINQQINDLTKMKKMLDKLITSCGKGNKAHCPIVETLANQS